MPGIEVLFAVLVYLTVLALLYIIFKGKALGLWFG